MNMSKKLLLEDTDKVVQALDHAKISSKMRKIIED